ncbi:WD40/YVTN/BNR-like repeat-containing protein, partial [Lutibacter sp.]
MKLKLKNKLPFIIIITIITLISINYITKFNDFNQVLTNVEKLRKQHEYLLKNSPFKKTLSLTRKERIEQGLPPNKYYEREWELTMNPATGKPEPNKILVLQKRLKNKSLSKRNPGDAVDNSWVDRGPNNVGGRTRIVLFDPNDATNKRVFAGGVSGGLWVNPDITNASSTWTQVSGVPGNMNISCITVDPNDSNTWYIGTGEQYTFGAAVGNGVYKTTDGGTNWVNVPVQVAGGGNSGNLLAGIYFINDIIAWDNAGTTEVFIGVGGHVYGDSANPSNWLGLQSAGLYRTADGGANWSRIESANMSFVYSSYTFYYIPNDLEISANNTLWMGSITTPGTGGLGGGKVFSSTDGTTWTEAATSPLTTSDRVELAVSSSNANKLYALTEGDDGTNAPPPHIFVTTDAFATTTELAKPDDADTGISAADFTRGQAFYDLVIEVDPTDDTIVYVGGID